MSITYGKMVYELCASVTVPQSGTMLHQFINRLMIIAHFPLDCLNVFQYFDVVIFTNSNIFNQFVGSKNFKILRQEMRSRGFNISPWFPINGNSRWARWLPYYWKLSTPCCCGPVSSQGYRSFPRHQLRIIDTCLCHHHSWYNSHRQVLK